jgi:hypothetical protein
MAERGEKFDAGRYLTTVNGREYLEVKWRLLWLRTEHPDAAVQTELMEHRDGYALFKARVALPGGGEATGWGSENAEDFGEYLEKAETKALGRALAALGFGTQFCEDFEYQVDGEQRLVDTPVERPGRRLARPKPGLATPAQVNALYAIARQVLGWDEAALANHVAREHGRPPDQLTKAEASRLIDELKQGVEAGPAAVRTAAKAPSR